MALSAIDFEEPPYSFYSQKTRKGYPWSLVLFGWGRPGDYIVCIHVSLLAGHACHEFQAKHQTNLPRVWLAFRQKTSMLSGKAVVVTQAS